MRVRWLPLALMLAAQTALAQHRPIANIGAFLDQCPDRDPALAEISRDFQIRRLGVVVATPPCTEPISAMPVAQYTDALIAMQGLRVIYYMDRGMSGHLPWTSGTLYDWMKSKIGGIDIVDGGSFCCEYFGPPLDPPIPPKPGEPPTPPTPPSPKYSFIAIGAEDDFNRDFDKRWRGIAGNIDLYAHETRHTDGFPHSSCCGIPGGCDDNFDAASLSPYGVQWWLNNLWLKGTINVGYECLTPSEISQTTLWFQSATNSFRERFCANLSPSVSAPPLPGGACLEGSPRRRAARHGL